MPKVQETVTITFDEEVIAVEQASAQIKEMVQIMDEWRQQEMDAGVLLTMIRAAMRDIQNNIVMTFRKEKESAQTNDSSPEVVG